MNQLYGSAQRCACTVLAGVFSACCSLPAVEAQEVREERKAAPLSLDTSHIVAPPLNDAYEVNAGAFGAKTAMEIPLVIQSYDAKTIADSSARTAVDVLSLDPSILSASAGSGFDNFRLRGFAMDNFNTIRRDGLALAPHHDFPWRTWSASTYSRGRRASCTGSTPWRHDQLHPQAPDPRSLAQPDGPGLVPGRALRRHR